MRIRGKRKKPAVAPENLTESGIYYKKLADKYHIAVRIVLVLLVIFLIAALITGHSSLKAENFRYLLQSAGLGASAAENPYSNIVYTADSSTAFALYEENLAVAGDGSVCLYHPSGEVLFRISAKGKATVDTSGKYMAVYAPGSRSLTLYHSFAQVHAQTTESPIGTAAVAENGAFAVSVTEGSGASILVYNSEFQLAYTWTIENGVVFDLAISPDGKSVAVLLLSFSSGSYYTELAVKNIRTDRLLTTEQFPGKTPVCVEFFSGGGFFAAVDGSISFYRAGGEKISQQAIPADSFRYSTDGRDVAILTSSSQIAVFSGTGDRKAEFSLERTAFDIDYYDGLVCCISEATLYLCDTSSDTATQYQVDEGVLDLFLLDDGSVLLCYASGAKRWIP